MDTGRTNLFSVQDVFLKLSEDCKEGISCLRFYGETH